MLLAIMDLDPDDESFETNILELVSAAAHIKTSPEQHARILQAFEMHSLSIPSEGSKREFDGKLDVFASRGHQTP